jgi:hypothetical protein
VASAIIVLSIVVFVVLGRTGHAGRRAALLGCATGLTFGLTAAFMKGMTTGLDHGLVGVFAV